MDYFKPLTAFWKQICDIDGDKKTHTHNTHLAVAAGGFAASFLSMMGGIGGTLLALMGSSVLVATAVTKYNDNTKAIANREGHMKEM